MIAYLHVPHSEKYDSSIILSWGNFFRFRARILHFPSIELYVVLLQLLPPSDWASDVVWSSLFTTQDMSHKVTTTPSHMQRFSRTQPACRNAAAAVTLSIIVTASRPFCHTTHISVFGWENTMKNPYKQWKRWFLKRYCGRRMGFHLKDWILIVNWIFWMVCVSKMCCRITGLTVRAVIL